MCKSGCLLLTLEPAAAGFGRALPPPLRRACAKSWRSVVAGNATGAAWYDGMSAAATRALPLDDVEGGEAADVLLLFDERRRVGKSHELCALPGRSLCACAGTPTSLAFGR